MKKNQLKDKLVAVVRIRGRVNVRSDITETLNRLNLKRVSNCTLVKVTDSYNGMLNKCTNYVAYGEIDEATLSKLLEKHAKELNAKELLDGKYDAEKVRSHLPFRLHPPRHGYKSTKLHFKQGGSLGYMGAEINKLIIRMV
ncbi:MAG: uL30 family ribosomal protein [Candidatus Micrarchaeota archaeon]|nr:uL30 family ribosomal protein [Candidatus Micrarchaeota archaeon]